MRCGGCVAATRAALCQDSSKLCMVYLLFHNLLLQKALESPASVSKYVSRMFKGFQGFSDPFRLKIHQRGVQWKQGVVICMVLKTSLLYDTTPIRCTPISLHPSVLNTHVTTRVVTTQFLRCALRTRVSRAFWIVLQLATMQCEPALWTCVLNAALCIVHCGAAKCSDTVYDIVYLTFLEKGTCEQYNMIINSIML